MRINDAYRQPPTSVDAPRAQPASSESAGAARAEGQASPPVTVTVSDKARELAAQNSDASDAKVAALQSSIAAGTFKVNPQAIASKIVDGE